MKISRSVLRVAVIVVALLALSPRPARVHAANVAVLQRALPERALPERLTDAEYWKLVTDISEPGGVFRIVDNFTSNEGEIGQLFSSLRATAVQGDVYLGVGPEQNFTYIAAVRPRMAFICDIRRQAVVQHLMFKMVFEMARDRAEFVSILFSKPRPDGLDSTTAIERIWDAYRVVASDTSLQRQNYARISERIAATHKFTLTADELSQLKKVHDAFQYYSEGITTQSGSNQFGGRGGGRGSALTFASLTGGLTDSTGQVRSFLSSEENYRFVKSMHERNLIVAVSGDFGGPKAMRAIGAYIRANGGTLRAFYVSNVEQYLFQEGKDQAFYDNVATFPVDSGSVFIRPYSLRRGRGGGPYRALCPITPFLAAAAAGRAPTYDSSVSCAGMQ